MTDEQRIKLAEAEIALILARLDMELTGARFDDVAAVVDGHAITVSIFVQQVVA